MTETNGPWILGDLMEHHRGHISNIRCMASPVRTAKYVHSNANRSLLVTGGGRGQVGLWFIGWNAGKHNNLWRPGWLGSIKLHHTFDSKPKSTVGSTHNTQKQSNNSAFTDLRVMALVCVELSESVTMDSVLILAACSDGSIRVVHAHPPIRESPHIAKFVEVDNLPLASSVSDDHVTRPCYLDMKLLHLFECGLSIIATDTSGNLECWSVHWKFPTSVTLECHYERQWIICAEPIAPFFTHTSPAFNCVDIACIRFPIKNPAITIVVGADDGSVRVASTLLTYHSGRPPEWISSGVNHHSAVLKVMWASRNDDKRSVISLASDHRVLIWDFEMFEYDPASLQPIRCVLLSGIGDPHDLAVDRTVEMAFCEHDIRPVRWAIVTGVGSTLLRVC